MPVPRTTFPSVARALRLATVVVATMLIAPAASHAWEVTRTSAPVLYIDTATNNGQLFAAYASYRVRNTTGQAQEDVWVRATDFTGGVVGLATHETGLIQVGSMAAGESRAVFVYLGAASATTTAQNHTIRVFDGKPGLDGQQLTSQAFSLTVESRGFNNANKVSSVTTSTSNPSLGARITVTVRGETGTIGAAKILSFTPAAYADFPASSLRLVGTEIKLEHPDCPTTTRNCATVVDALRVPLSDVVDTQNTPYTATYTFLARNVTSTQTRLSPVGYISSGSSPSHTSTGNFATLPPIQPVQNRLRLTKTADRSRAGTSPASRTVTYTVNAISTSADQVVFSDFTERLPDGATYVEGSARWGGQAIADPAASGDDLVFVQTFAVPAGGTRALTYQAVLADQPGEATNRVVGHSGATQLDRTLDTTDDAPATATVLVDHTGPAASFLLTPPDRTTSRVARFAFVSEPDEDAPVSFECRLDGAAWGPCESPLRLADLSYEEHELEVRAIDGVGNAGTSVRHAWTVENLPDQTPPTSAFWSGPPAITGSTTATLAFIADEDATFECQIATGSWEPCTSPVELSDLAAGEHTFSVRAIDDGGLVGEPVSRTWTFRSSRSTTVLRR
jgi:hypothetical protein